MSQIIFKCLENTIDKYIDVLAVSYKLNKKELKQKWIEMDDLSKKTLPTTMDSNKKNGYQVFFSLKRNELKNTNPQISYAEITKEISNMWNKLSQTEKNKYCSEMLPQLKTTFTFEELNDKKMSELKEICEKYGIKKGGNKSELIKNLLGQNHSNDNNPKSKSKIVQTITTPTNDLSVELYNPEEKRTDFQMEENDMEYEYSSNSSDDADSDVSESSIELNEEDFDN
jgi:hypothetical protein